MIGRIPLSRLMLREVDDDARNLAERVPCSPLTALLLKMRGISEDDPLEARAQLNPGLGDSMDRLDLGPVSSRAADLWRSLEGAERVVVYGDYDADGACATTLAMELALAAFREVRYFIPHRHREGYGVHEKVVRAIARNGCDLLIVVDCGTRDIAALRAAREADIPVIVFDHHSPGESLPEGALVVNPHAGGYPEAQTLCATGVLWTWARSEGIADPGWIDARTDLAAIATLADHVPLGRLNRSIVSRGMEAIRMSGRRGLVALMTEIGCRLEEVDEELLVMKVIPCLNAAGRLGLADISVDVLLGGQGMEDNVRELVRLNRKRQSLAGEILEEALPRVKEGSSLVLSDFSWPVGVLSGVASRICSETGVPVALASLSGDHVRGTLRVPQGVDALKVLEPLAPRLLSWGGHRFAAGFSVSRSEWAQVRDLMEEILLSASPSQETVQAIVFPPEMLTPEEVGFMNSLGPFGAGNPHPLFFFPAGGMEIRPLGRDGRHVKVLAERGEFLAFGGAALSDSIRNSRGWTFRPRINRWKGRSRVDFIMESIAVTEGAGKEGCGP
ncbi:MAG: Phosphoesterase RecJ domain protein [Synergistales bacterium 58_81]|nr:MAG: Phosphoesterase RecJ domain protein [Synergistales bacterium 58_81]